MRMDVLQLGVDPVQWVAVWAVADDLASVILHSFEAGKWGDSTMR